MKLLEVLDEVEIDNFLVPTYQTKGWILCNHIDGYVDLFLGKGVVLRNVESNALRVHKKTTPKIRPYVIEAIRLILLTQHESVSYLQEIKEDPPRIVQNRIDDVVFLTGRGLNHAVFSTFIKAVSDVHNLHYQSVSYKNTASGNIQELNTLRQTTVSQQKSLQTAAKEKHVLMESFSKHTFDNQSKREAVLNLRADNSELTERMETISVECDRAVLHAMELEKENRNLLQDYEELRGKYAQILANQHRSDIESDKLIMDLDNSLAESKVLSQKVERLKQQVKVADGKIEMLHTEKVHEQRVQANTATEVIRLQRLIQSQKQQIQDLQEENERVEVEIGGLKGKLGFKEEEMERKKIEIDELRNVHIESKMISDNLRLEVDHKALKIASLETQIFEIKAHHQHEMARKEGDMKMLQDTHHFARKQIERMKEEIEGLISEKAKAAEKIQQLYQIEIELQTKLSDFRFQHETLKIDHTRSLKKLTQRESDAMKQETRIEKVTADTQLLRSLVTSLQQNHTAMGSQLGRWRSRLDDASTNIENIALESPRSVQRLPSVK